MRFLIVDDHVLIREAMRSVLHEVAGGCEILEANSGASALQSLTASPDVDLVLLDLNLPDRNGLDILSAIVGQHPATAVVILSGNEDSAIMRDALERGVQGFIPKSESREVLVHALALILAGGTYVPPAALQSVPSRSATSERHRVLDSLGLTDRQLDVLALLMEGKNNKLICRELNISEPTAKNHVTAILRALGVSSRTEAVLAVTRLGWSPPRNAPRN